MTQYRWQEVGDNKDDLMVFDRASSTLYFVSNYRLHFAIPEGAPQDEADKSGVAGRVIGGTMTKLTLARSRLNSLSKALNNVMLLGSTWPDSSPVAGPEKAEEK